MLAKILIVVLAAALIGVVVLGLMGKFNGIGLGPGTGIVPGENDTVPAVEMQTEKDTSDKDNTPEDDEEDSGNISEYLIEISEDKIYVNEKEYPTAEEFSDYIADTYKDSNTYTLIDNYAIAGTYDTVKDILESQNIIFAEKTAAEMNEQTESDQ